MLTIDRILTSDSKYPERLKSPECTQIVKDNAARLVAAVNAFLQEIGIQSVTVSSGFRTSGANSALANSAKKSLHMQSLAVDLLDNKEQSLAKLIETKPELMRKYGLFMENKDYTKGQWSNWVHLDISPTRSDRPNRVFNP